MIPIILPVDKSICCSSLFIKSGKIVLKAALDADAKTVYWFVNDYLEGKAKAGEILEISPAWGQMTTKAIDDMARFSSVKIEVNHAE